MLCNIIEEISIRHLEGQLKGLKRHKFEKHILSCESCKNKYNEIRNNYDTSIEVKEFADLRTSVMQEIQLQDVSYKDIRNIIKENPTSEDALRMEPKPSKIKNRFIPGIVGMLEVAVVILVLFSIPHITKQYNRRNVVSIPTNPPVVDDNPVIMPTSTPMVGDNDNKKGIVEALKSRAFTIALTDNIERYIEAKAWDNLDDASLYLISDNDIKGLISELKQFENTDIWINKEYYTENSVIVLEDNIIKVNNKSLQSPYEITFAMREEVTKGDLLKSDGVILQLKSRGIGISIEAAKELPFKEFALPEDYELEFKNGTREFRSKVSPKSEAEKVVFDDYKILISDEYDEFVNLYINDGRTDHYPRVFKQNLEAGLYTESVVIHNIRTVKEDEYIVTVSGSYYAEKLKTLNPYKFEIVEIDYTRKVTEEADRSFQWGSGRYTRYYVLIKLDGISDWRIYEVYGHM
jgi:hypothetical protein